MFTRFDKHCAICELQHVCVCVPGKDFTIYLFIVPSFHRPCFFHCCFAIHLFRFSEGLWKLSIGFLFAEWAMCFSFIHKHVFSYRCIFSYHFPTNGRDCDWIEWLNCFIELRKDDLGKMEIQKSFSEELRSNGECDSRAQSMHISLFYFSLFKIHWKNLIPILNENHAKHKLNRRFCCFLYL